MDLFTGKKLADLRKLNGLSQESLAEKMNVSRQAVSKWERGEASPDTDNLMLLARLYGITVDDILGEKKAVEIAAGQTAQAEINSTPQAETTVTVNEENPTEKQNKQSKTEHKKAKPKLFNKKEKVPKGERYMPQKAKRLLRFPYPIIVIILFLVLGLKFKVWHPAWLIFLTIPIYYLYALSYNAYSKRSCLLRKPVFFVLLLIYLISGFIFNLWHPTWLIFLILPMYLWIVLGYNKKR